MEIIWIDANDFKTYGGWQTETQFVKEMADAGIVTDKVSPKLLPNYARKV